MNREKLSVLEERLDHTISSMNNLSNRMDTLGDRLLPIERFINKVEGAVKFITLSSVIIGAVVGALKILG